ncbi:sugar ABC transporter ATP-binding protein [Rhizobium tumorigenes]|uniref:Sugar ABC transporter ATP-binding protein n=1 Tax=Rhizobium tumorigenes TaxID=2041385 RepID=A0AAF1KEQ0_9HYPH|nr:sugar ABC transporter ATP-binding protein [Rhizobium tumorigenes]WFR98806.1 sugar ABC transporter ATP-binding protein [Rhizobium tumorigenes]
MTFDPKGADVPILEMRGISKTFGSIKALSGVSLTVHRGEVHALMGENGAGKSTLMKILSGAYVPDEGGTVSVASKLVAPGSPRASKEAGIAVIYQELSLAPNLTIAQNIYLGAERASYGFVRRGEQRSRCAAVLERLGLQFSPETLVESLSIGERQMVEIARALSFDPRILVMDEPTTSLTSRETDRLFEVIRDLKRQGIAVIYISHRMEEIYALSDRVTVLRDAKPVGTLDRAQLSPETLVSMMVGRDVSTFYKKTHVVDKSAARIVLAVRSLSDGHKVRDCSLDIREGEVVGLSGLVGSGRTELARLIYGADPFRQGEVSVDGAAASINSPSDGIAAGIAYLTEDRKGLGLFLDMSIRENVNVSVIGRDAHRLGFLNFRTASERSKKAFSEFGIRAAHDGVTVGSLSGGNQQKVLLARLMEAKPKIVILDEPTRGVDVGAKSEIYRLIDALAQNGVAILLISSELPEIIGVSDRVLVMNQGRISGEVRPAADGTISQQEIMAFSTGTAPAVAA